jgi:transcription initiation factor IIE alpha subunit
VKVCNGRLFEVLRQLKRKLKAEQNHSHYVGNNNESLRLDQVIAADPPEGGMAAYLQHLNEDSK